MATEHDQIAALETRAAHVRSLLPFARRAFVLELAGTPKAGKSTSVEAIRHFFSRNGFRVHVLAERAAECPIPMKGHLFFNIWCMTSMLAELLENVETETDIIIVDRGLFDSLVWLTAQHERGELTADEAGRIESFTVLDRWTVLMDLVAVMSVSPKQALERERSQRIATGDGSIMNLDTLSRLHGAVVKAAAKYKPEFKRIIEHNSVGTIRSSNISLVSAILDEIDIFLDPNILVVKKPTMLQFCKANTGRFSTECVTELKGFLSKNATLMKRSEAEVDNSVVQIVASTALCYGNKVFKFDRKEKDPKSSYTENLPFGKAATFPRKKTRSSIKLLRPQETKSMNRSF